MCLEDHPVLPSFNLSDLEHLSNYKTAMGLPLTYPSDLSNISNFSLLMANMSSESDQLYNHTGALDHLLTNIQRNLNYSGLTDCAGEPEDSLVAYFRQHFRTYFTLLLIIIGCLGNIISCCILCRIKKLRKISCLPYMLGTAISNTAFLLTHLYTTLDSLVGFAVFNKSLMCHFVTWMSGTSATLGQWYALLASLDRLVLWGPKHCFPMLAPFRNHSKLISFILGLFVLAIFLNFSMIYSLIELMPGLHICVPVLEDYSQIQYLSVFDSFINHLLPSVVTLVSSAVIVRRLCTHRRMSLCVENELHRDTMTQDRIVTKTLVVHNMMRLSLSLPCLLMTAYHSMANLLYPEYQAKAGFYQWLTYLQYPYNAHFGTLLYACLICLRSFRRKLLCRCKRSSSRGFYNDFILAPTIEVTELE